jgi:hypothetical protein
VVLALTAGSRLLCELPEASRLFVEGDTGRACALMGVSFASRSVGEGEFFPLSALPRLGGCIDLMGVIRICVPPFVSVSDECGVADRDMVSDILLIV